MNVVAGRELEPHRLRCLRGSGLTAGRLPGLGSKAEPFGCGLGNGCSTIVTTAQTRGSASGRAASPLGGSGQERADVIMLYLMIACLSLAMVTNSRALPAWGHDLRVLVLSVLDMVFFFLATARIDRRHCRENLERCPWGAHLGHVVSTVYLGDTGRAGKTCCNPPVPQQGKASRGGERHVMQGLPLGQALTFPFRESTSLLGSMSLTPIFFASRVITHLLIYQLSLRCRLLYASHIGRGFDASRGGISIRGTALQSNPRISHGLVALTRPSAHRGLRFFQSCLLCYFLFRYSTPTPV